MTLVARDGALTHDAELWEKVSKALIGTADAAHDLVLTQTALPGNDLDAAYAELQDHIVMLLTEGGFQAIAVANVLRQIDTDLTATDQTAADAAAHLWKRLGGQP